MKTKERELSRKIERRLEMIYAHTKRGKTAHEVINPNLTTPKIILLYKVLFLI